MKTLWKIFVNVLGWGVITLFAAVFLLGFGLTWPLEVLVFMGTGWAFFLSDVLPQVRVNPLAVTETLLVAAVLAWGLHRFLQRLWRLWHMDAPEARPWPVRWSVSLLALGVLLFGATMATVGLAHQVGWLVSSPEPLLINSWRITLPVDDPQRETLCEEAWALVGRDVPDALIVSTMLREPRLQPLLEQLAVVPWTDAESSRGFLVFSRDPLIRAREGGLRCRGRGGNVLVLSESELSHLLEAAQAGGGGTSASPM